MVSLTDSQHKILLELRDLGLTEQANEMTSLFMNLQEGFAADDARIAQIMSDLKFAKNRAELPAPDSRLEDGESRGGVPGAGAVNSGSPGPSKADAEQPGLVQKVLKPMIHLVDFEFVMHMAGALTKPIVKGKYPPFGWKEIDSDEVRRLYFDALFRHASAAKEGEYLDEDDVPHWAAVAVNAMILWWHQKREQKKQ